MSLLYSAHDVFATYTRIFLSVQLLVNEEFFHQSSFELIKTSFINPATILSNFVHQCRELLAWELLTEGILACYRLEF